MFVVVFYALKLPNLLSLHFNSYSCKFLECKVALVCKIQIIKGARCTRAAGKRMKIDVI